MKTQRTLIQYLFTLLLLCFSLSTLAITPLPADKAFTLSTKFFGEDTIVLTWQIAPNHYIYKERIAFKIIEPKNASIGTILMPKGQLQENELLESHEVYGNRITIPVPIIDINPQKTLLSVTYQGCSKSGYCYPPTTQAFNISVDHHTITPLSPPKSGPAAPPAQYNGNSEQEERYISLLSGSHLATILLAFFGFGILLSFTPCCLPMLPVLSGIILGHKGKMSTGKAFRLSSVYVLSMALTYAVAGMLIGFIGGSVQAIFQQTWILALFSALFVLLALSFFGLYQLKLPEKLQTHLAELSHKQKAGHYLGVAIMGCLATLILSPCVTPALVGILGYIGQTGNVVLGGSALFAMGLGMGLPLIIVGTTGGKFLPKAGHWMETLEYCFGVFFLAMAIWILDRVLPASIIMMLYAILLIVSAIYMGALSHATSSWGKLWKGVGCVLFVYGVLLMIGMAQGNTDLFQPLRHYTSNGSITAAPKNIFLRVNTSAQLKQELNTAAAQGKPVVLDFYADWCIACKEMEQTTFRDPNVIKMLSSDFVTLQVDVTQNSAEDNKIMQELNVVAPPTLLFFAKDGRLLKGASLVGKTSAADLVKQLNIIHNE
jgi:thiol:disulfide interchange protein DsbD